MKRMRSFITTLGMLAVAMAIYQELRKPPEERTWHGRLLDFIPYDFRAPTIERVKEAMWNPNDPRLFTGEVFGVGWTVNLYQAKQRLVGGLQSA